MKYVILTLSYMILDNCIVYCIMVIGFVLHTTVDLKKKYFSFFCASSCRYYEVCEIKWDDEMVWLLCLLFPERYASPVIVHSCPAVFKSISELCFKCKRLLYSEQSMSLGLRPFCNSINIGYFDTAENKQCNSTHWYTYVHIYIHYSCMQILCSQCEVFSFLLLMC